jgi:putative ABC transport system permease protein
MLPLIALRNLARNRRRTLLSLSVVSFGFLAILLTGGFVRESFAGLSEALIHGGLGHIEIAPGAAGDLSAQTGKPPAFEDWQRVRQAVEGRGDVRAAGATIQFAGVATHGELTASVVGLGVEPDRETRIGTDVRIRDGANLQADRAAGDPAVLLGMGLARALGAKPGDLITLMAATPDGSLNAMDVEVVGLFTTGIQELDARMIKTRLADAQQLLGTDKVTSLIVGLTNSALTATAAGELQREVADSTPALHVADWESRAPFYGQVRGLYIGIFAFLGTIVAVLVTLSSSNTMLMSVLERVREFGMLLAIGTSRSQIGQLLVFEAIWLSIIGCAIGSVAGMAAVAVINNIGIKMPPPPGAVDPIDLALRVAPSDFAFIFAGLTIVLIAGTIPPLLRVFRLKIVESLSHI